MNNKYRLDFEGSSLITNTNSQSGQDVFVLSCLDGKRDGTFLDLGSNDAVKINNTYLLEEQFGWTGVSIDIDPAHAASYVQRSTPFLIQDCVTLNYDDIKSRYSKKHIDYLSLDLEPASITFECLKNIPSDLEFSVITYEHDSYRFGNTYRDASRAILEAAGYVRVCSDVKNNGSPYEDWYFNPKYINPARIETLVSQDKEWSDIIFSK